MVTSSKFKFDTVFEVDKNGRNVEFDEPKPQFTDEDLAAARGEGQRLGFEAGLHQARGEIEAAAAAALAQIATHMTEINNTHRAEILSIECTAAELAYSVGNKLAPALLARQPLEEVKALVAECLAMMSTEPRVAVRIADPMIEPLQAHIDQLIAQTGFEGQVALLAEPSLTGTDCRVEWADGGTERDLESLQHRVEDAVARYCASLNRERDDHLAACAQDAQPDAIEDMTSVGDEEMTPDPAQASPVADEDEDLLSEPLPVLHHIPDFGAGSDIDPAPARQTTEEFTPPGGT